MAEIVSEIRSFADQANNGEVDLESARAMALDLLLELERSGALDELRPVPY